MLSSEAHPLKRVVVCTPRAAYFDVDDLAAHNILEVADRRAALRQHDRLKEILTGWGAEVIDLPEPAGHPNAVFTRDAALSTPRGFIELRPGIRTRRGEGRWMAGCLERLGLPRAGTIEPPGTVDGGDVLLLDRVAFIGRSRRTNDAGCRQLSGLLGKMGYEVRRVALPDKVLHLDKVLMPVGPERLLVCANVVDRGLCAGFERIEIEFDGEATANIICLGDGEWIVGDTNRAVIEKLDAGRGGVHPIDISEFVKGAGGPNCLILPVERADSRFIGKKTVE